MEDFIKRTHDFYNHVPGARIVQTEFGYYCMDRWKREGYITDKTDLYELFGHDRSGKHRLGQLGWCEASFCPKFEEKILEDRGDYEVVQDFAGRSVLCFKGRRNGFMPEYIDHPVKDFYTWEALKWRLDSTTPERFSNLDARMAEAKRKQTAGYHIVQDLVGGYMYLRSLIGPGELLYLFYDEPELIHACMKTWFELADSIIAKHQEHVTLDELFIAEDICYNSGPLISPDMIREFLFPYYQQLIQNIKRRQPDKRLILQVDTDGDCRPVIPLYQSIGFDYFSPFEAASGCDVVEIRKQYPEILMRGGFDKRILAKGKDAIAREVERIMPFMTAEGGYTPTCDHGVPEEVNFEDYLYFRELMKAF